MKCCFVAQGRKAFKPTLRTRLTRQPVYPFPPPPEPRPSPSIAVGLRLRLDASPGSPTRCRRAAKARQGLTAGLV
jgi:hypothetical protein